MKIHIFGSSENISNSYVKKAVLVFAEKLMGQDFIKDLNVEISFEDDMEDDGKCGPYENRFSDPKEFYIGINANLSKINILQTLAHEMVHVKQYAFNEITESRTSDYIIFRSSMEPFVKSFEGFNKDLDYYDRPWEIEAHGREIGLINLLKGHRHASEL